MTNPTPYNKKGERWVNHTVQPGSYVVNDPRPPPPPPPFTKPTGQTWARPGVNNRPPPNISPVNVPPNPYAITTAPPPVAPAPPPAPSAPVPIPQAFQTPKGKTPRFYDPDDFRKFTETHSTATAGSYQPTYSTPVSDSQGRTFLPVMGDTNKRGPYSERLTRVEETELLRTCMRLRDTYGAPSTQNKWWQTAAADFSVYRRRQGRNDLQAPTAKRRVELATAKRKREIEDGKESDEPAEYVAALNEWVGYVEKLDKGETQPMSSKQAAEAKLDEELQRIKKEKEEADRDNPLPTPPPSSSTPTSQGPRAGQNAQTPVMLADSPPPNTQPRSHRHPMTYAPPVYGPPAPPLTHHHAIPLPIDPRPTKRPRIEGPDTPNGQVNDALERTTAALDVMTKLASSMFESQQKGRDQREKTKEPASAGTQDTDMDMNGSTENLFSPAETSTGNASNDLTQRLEELERKLDEQKEANAVVQEKLDDMTTKISKFTDEATAAEGREKDRDKKMDKILQVLKKHFQGQGQS